MKNGKDVIVKLTAFESFRKENPIYRCQSNSNDKNKGNMMIKYLKDLFNIGAIDEQEYFKKEVEEQKKLISNKNFGSTKIDWTRDEKGNIISPFSAKLKSDKGEDL